MVLSVCCAKNDKTCGVSSCASAGEMKACVTLMDGEIFLSIAASDNCKQKHGTFVRACMRNDCVIHHEERNKNGEQLQFVILPTNRFLVELHLSPYQ